MCVLYFKLKCVYEQTGKMHVHVHVHIYTVWRDMCRGSEEKKSLMAKEGSREIPLPSSLAAFTLLHLNFYTLI